MQSTMILSKASEVISKVNELSSFDEVATWDDNAHKIISELKIAIGTWEENKAETEKKLAKENEKHNLLPFWKRWFDDMNYRNELKNEISKFSSRISQANQYIVELEDWIVKTPDDIEQSKALIQELKRIKKELLQQKKEVQANIRQVNVAARQRNAEISNQVFVSSKFRQVQRMSVRSKKEELLKPNETLKSLLDNQIFEIDKTIIWIEKIVSGSKVILTQNKEIKPSKIKKEVISQTVKKDELKIEKVEDILNELNTLIGLSNIKEDVASLINYLKVQKKRAEAGLPTTKLSHHSVFLGPPGTGKTTVARIMGRVYKSMGILERGHIIETDRAGLVGGYLGQTAIKVEEMINSALDGILFIDEAYSLASKDDSYGQEAIETLLKRMEDYRDRLIVIVAGYPKEMERFLDSNPGLKSRFNKTFSFHNYSANELTDILKSFVKKGGYTLSPNAEKIAISIFSSELLAADTSFGNARYVRNLFERILTNHANRLVNISQPSKEQLITIEADDFK